MKKKLLVTLAAALLGAVVSSHADAQITPPAGPIPTGLPARLSVGLFEDPGATWMRNSAVPWDVRYAYFTKGWADNWGWGARDGAFARNYFNECDANRYIPAVQYYQMFGEPGGGEGEFFRKTQNAGTMASYFSDFKLLMQRAKEFGKPVVVMLEADGFAYMQQASGNNPSAYSAVAATGLPELASLPNTAAGWGLAFLQIRKSVGASNVTLGIHVSGWASGKDIVYFSTADAIQPEVDKVYNFLAPLGLASNVTGATYDFLVGDPLDRDPEYYRVSQGQDRWLDTNDSASIASKSFNRLAEWLRLWNVKSQKRWVLWQIPLGNSNHLNVHNNGGARQGYKGNFPEYYFNGANSRAHLEKFASSGVVSLLFGAGIGGMSSYQNDTYTDGRLFMQSRAGDFLKAGGLAIPGGTTTTPPTTPPPTNPPPTSGDTAAYNFEGTTQGFVSSGAPITGLSVSTAQKFAGTRSLAVAINGSGQPSVSVNNPTARAGQLITFRVYVPATGISWVQPYIMQGAAGNWAWTGNWRAMSSLTAGWNTLTVQVPSNAAALYQLGVQFGTNGSYNGSLFVDSISY